MTKKGETLETIIFVDSRTSVLFFFTEHLEAPNDSWDYPRVLVNKNLQLPAF